jgi:hypothetical protein
MFESLATHADADLILKLYELRTEATMREARAWMASRFFPQTAKEFFAVTTARTAPENAWFRQVTSYWEMAAALVLHGALNAELFVDCNAEPFFLYAKFLPLLPEIRKKMPGFLIKVEQLVEQSPVAQAKMQQAANNLAAMPAARK